MKFIILSRSVCLFLILFLNTSIPPTVFSQDEIQTNSDPQSVDIVVDSYSFKPDKITVTVNNPVELRLRSVTSINPHNFTLDYPEAGLEVNEDIGSGKDTVVAFTPTKAGEYEFYCGKKSIFANHKKKGMVGSLVVVE